MTRQRWSSSRSGRRSDHGCAISFRHQLRTDCGPKGSTGCVLPALKSSVLLCSTFLCRFCLFALMSCPFMRPHLTDSRAGWTLQLPRCQFWRTCGGSQSKDQRVRATFVLLPSCSLYMRRSRLPSRVLLQPGMKWMQLPRPTHRRYRRSCSSSSLCMSVDCKEVHMRTRQQLRATPRWLLAWRPAWMQSKPMWTRPTCINHREVQTALQILLSARENHLCCRPARFTISASSRGQAWPAGTSCILRCQAVGVLIVALLAPRMPRRRRSSLESIASMIRTLLQAEPRNRQLYRCSHRALEV